MKCPCHSGQEYENCCASYHQGTPPPDAQKLMRSRYSAYALGKSDYIMKTTHPDHPDYNAPNWENQIQAFSRTTQFTGLEIFDFQEEGNKSTVTFRATLAQNGHDCSYTEKSCFEKLGDWWLYKSGSIS